MSSPDALLRAFHMSPEDLAANRADRLGAGQVERLRRNIWINVAVVAPMQILLIAFIVLVRPSTVGLFLAGALLVLLTLAEVSWAMRIRRAIRAGTVRCLRGRVKVHRSVQSGTWISVDGQRNRLWAKPHYVIPDGEYRVYVAPDVRLVVAMELESWD